MDPEQLRSLMPWRHPFVLIDRVLECVPHRRIVAAKLLRGDDMMVRAHRPGTALFPGLMVVEGMGQSAAVLFQLSYGRIPPGKLPLLGHMKASFSGAAEEGDEIAYTVKAVKMTSTSGLFEGSARVGERAIASAELAFAVAPSSAARDGEGDR